MLPLTEYVSFLYSPEKNLVFMRKCEVYSFLESVWDVVFFIVFYLIKNSYSLLLSMLFNITNLYFYE